MPTFSAYMSVYNDVDLLAHVLPSWQGRIDELVIVDGGYDWMEGYLRAIGKNPARSDAQLYQLLDASGIAYRCLNKVWKNEIEKRTAGYAACNTDYVFRVDADEVSFFRDEIIEKFVQQGAAVAEMELPMYDSPGLIQCGGPGKPLPRQGFLFNRHKVDAAQHLHYLWLVLTADQLDQHQNERYQVFPDAVAFNAHLSNWRTPDGGVQRAAFYVMNYFRANGVPFVPELRNKPLNDFAIFLKYIPPAVFGSAMKRSEVINGQHKLDGNILCPTPLTVEQDVTFADAYQAWVAATRSFNDNAMVVDQSFINGQTLCFHCSGNEAGGDIRFRFSSPIVSAKASLHDVFDAPPFTAASSLDVRVDGETVVIGRAKPDSEPSRPLRRSMLLTVGAGDNVSFGSFRLESPLN